MTLLKYQERPHFVWAAQWIPGRHINGVHEEDGRAFVITHTEYRVYLTPGEWIVKQHPQDNRCTVLHPHTFEEMFVLFKEPHGAPEM